MDNPNGFEMTSAGMILGADVDDDHEALTLWMGQEYGQLTGASLTMDEARPLIEFLCNHLKGYDQRSTVIVP